MKFANIFSKFTIEISKFLNCKFQEFEKKLFLAINLSKYDGIFKEKIFPLQKNEKIQLLNLVS